MMGANMQQTLMLSNEGVFGTNIKPISIKMYSRPTVG